MEDTYRTVENISEGLYKEKGSKFISFAYPIKNEEEVKEIVNLLKEEYYDARHHCYAWRLGVENPRTRAVDDGEPSSTAGKPILGQIISQDLTNILIVVIRYFGGTKLGVSGLIVAYREAALDAIQNGFVIEKTVDDIFTITFSYMAMNDVMKVIKDLEPEVLERNFELECKMTLSIRMQNSSELRERLSKVESLAVSNI